MKKKYKLGLVGYGFIGKNHIEALINLKKFYEVKVIFDQKISKENKIKLPKGIILKKEFSKKNIPDDLDIIIICAPTYLHTKLTNIALTKVKNVITEKPIALYLKDAQNVIKNTNKNNKKVIVVKQMRFNPVYKKIKNAISNNHLNKIHFVNWNIFLNRSKKYFSDSGWKGKRKLDGGTLFNQISHYIDLLYWFFGDIKFAKGFQLIKNKNFNENSGQVSLFFKNKIFVSINYSIKSYKKNLTPSCTILAENGNLEIQNDRILIKNSNRKLKNFLEKDKKKFLSEQKNYGKGIQVFYENLYDFLKKNKNQMRKISFNQDVLNSYKNLNKISSSMKYLNIK